MVHKGFLDIVNSMSAIALRLIDDAENICPNCRVLVTGHSLGASLATLFVSVNLKSLPGPLSIYNFGSPRLGNAKFVSWFSGLVSSGAIAEHTRVTSMKDPVPHLPPRFMGYQHGPQEIWQLNNNNPPSLKICSATDGEDGSCTNSQNAFSLNVFDHGLYMGYSVYDGIPNGCLYTDSTVAEQTNKKPQLKKMMTMRKK